MLRGVRRHLRRLAWRRRAWLRLKAPVHGMSVNTEDGGAGTSLPPTCCMTSAVSLRLPRASVSLDQAFGESVLGWKSPVLLSCVCMPAEEVPCCVLELCRAPDIKNVAVGRGEPAAIGSGHPEMRVCFLLPGACHLCAAPSLPARSLPAACLPFALLALFWVAV